jgi:hypothetical protein
MAQDKSSYYLIFGSLILSFLILSPILNSGYISDDALNSLIPGYLQEGNTNVLSLSMHIIYSWMVNEGRFFPIAYLYAYSIFSLSPSLFIYKLFLISMILINSLLFYYLIKLLSKSEVLAIFSLLIIPIFFKVTLSHNPILSFNALIQVVFSLILLSLITLSIYLENQSRYYLIASLGLYFISLLTYEISYPLFLLHILIIFSHSKKRLLSEKLKTAFYFFIAPIICILLAKILTIYFTWPIVPKTSGIYFINLEVSPFLISLAKEISGTIPMSYILLDPHKIFNNNSIFLNGNVSMPLLFCIGIGSFILFFEISKRLLSSLQEENAKKSNKFLLPLVGLGFIILPLILISITPRHQTESIWGYSYLPGYISSYGVCICTICIGYLFYKKLSLSNTKNVTYLLLFFSAVFSICCMITFSANIIVVEHSNVDWLYPRQIAEEGMSNGIFNEIPNNSILLVDNNHVWDQPAFYRMHTGLHFNYIGSPNTATYDGPYISNKIPRLNNSDCSDYFCHYSVLDSNPVYYLNYYSNSKTEGIVTLGKINDISVTDQTILGGNTNKIIIYVKSSQINDGDRSSKVFVTGRWRDKTEDSAYESFILDESELTLLSKGNNWKIFSLDVKGKEVDLLSLLITTGSKNYHQSVQINNSKLDLQNSEMENPPTSPTSEEYIPFQVHFENNYFGEGVNFDPISLSNNFTVQLLVKPAATQVPYAGIIGNHPGYNNFEGFVIQQDNSNLNDYTFSFGNGTSWEPDIKFHLNDTEWNYLVVTVENKKILGYRNGELIGSCNVISTIKNSGMPLYVGNWIGTDRQFNGSIREVMTSNSSISNETIKSNWLSIQQSL